MPPGVDSFFQRILVNNVKKRKIKILAITMGILLPNLLLWTVAPGVIKNMDFCGSCYLLKISGKRMAHILQ